MATVFRGLGVTRYESPRRDNSLLTTVDAGPLDGLLHSQDTFFSGAGCGPDYDYPNPRGKPFPVELRTWICPLAIALFASALPQVQQHSPPPPLGKPFPSDLRTFANPAEIQLVGQDKVFAGPGEVPPYDYPNPRGKPFPSDLRTFVNPSEIQLVGQDSFFAGPGVGPDYDYPNPNPGKPYPVALRTWTQSPSLFGQDLFFTVAGQGPDYDFPNPTLRKSSASAFAYQPNNMLPLITAVVYPATFVFDYPNPRGRTYPSDLRTFAAPLAVNLAGQDRFFGAAGQPPAYDFPNPTLRRSSAAAVGAWQPNNNLVFQVVVVLPATTVFDYPNPRGQTYAVGLRTFTGSVPLNLLGKDQFFAAPGQAPRYDYPNPSLGKPFPSDLRTFVAPPALNLAGKDKFFGAAGEPPRYDYPNPRGKAFPNDLRTFTGFAPITFVPAPSASSYTILILLNAASQYV